MASVLISCSGLVQSPYCGLVDIDVEFSAKAVQACFVCKSASSCLLDLKAELHIGLI